MVAIDGLVIVREEEIYCEIGFAVLRPIIVHARNLKASGRVKGAANRILAADDNVSGLMSLFQLLLPRYSRLPPFDGAIHTSLPMLCRRRPREAAGPITDVDGGDLRPRDSPGPHLLHESGDHGSETRGRR